MTLAGHRITELREARGWNQAELGRKVGTSGQQIGRLEDGTRRLTLEWVERIAEALGVTPQEVLSSAPSQEEEDDVAPPPQSLYGTVMAALTKRGLKLFKVASDAVSEAGVGIGDVITVDESETAVAAVKTGDLVVCSINGSGGDERRSILRQFVAPRLLVTNRKGYNVALTMDDPTCHPAIVGVVVRD